MLVNKIVHYTTSFLCTRQFKDVKRTWKMQVEEEITKVGLRKEDTLRKTKWSVGVNMIADGLNRIWPAQFVLNTTTFYTLV